MTKGDLFWVAILSAGFGYVVAQIEICIRMYNTSEPHVQTHGFVLVPEEPTAAMLKAACASMSPGKRPTPNWIPVKEKHRIRYRAMIKAAQTRTP